MSELRLPLSTLIKDIYDVDLLVIGDYKSGFHKFTSRVFTMNVEHKAIVDKVMQGFTPSEKAKVYNNVMNWMHKVSYTEAYCNNFMKAMTQKIKRDFKNLIESVYFKSRRLSMEYYFNVYVDFNSNTLKLEGDLDILGNCLFTLSNTLTYRFRNYADYLSYYSSSKSVVEAIKNTIFDLRLANSKHGTRQDLFKLPANFVPRDIPYTVDFTESTFTKLYKLFL